MTYDNPCVLKMTQPFLCKSDKTKQHINTQDQRQEAQVFSTVAYDIITFFQARVKVHHSAV